MVYRKSSKGKKRVSFGANSDSGQAEELEPYLVSVENLCEAIKIVGSLLCACA